MYVTCMCYVTCRNNIYNTENSNFNPVMNCDNTVRADHPDSEVAGKAVIGSSCYITCKDGFKFKDHIEHRFKMTCEHFEYFIGWDVVGNSYDEIFGANCYPVRPSCSIYPQCIPV